MFKTESGCFEEDNARTCLLLWERINETKWELDLISKKKKSKRQVHVALMRKRQISPRSPVTPKFLDTLISFKPFGFCEGNSSLYSH